MTRHRWVFLALFLALLGATRASAVPCPGSGAKIKVIINNPTTTTGQTISISGRTVDG